MSMFPSASATFQPIISEVVNEVDRQQFVGSQILPILMSDVQKGKYVKILSAQFDNDISKPRAAGSNFAQASGEYSSGSFECVEYGVENSLDDLNIVEAESDAQ